MWEDALGDYEWIFFKTKRAFHATIYWTCMQSVST